MDWNKSYTASWRVFRVNRKTWADGEQIDNIDKVSISRTGNGRLIESGSLELTGEIETAYYRIVMTAEQGGEVERVDVATLLFEVGGGEYDYGVDTNTLDGSSVLYPASTTAVTTGEYAPSGIDGAQYAASLLRSAINAPVSVEGSFILEDYIVHELGSSILDAACDVLDAGRFVIQIDGRGEVHILPKPTSPALVLDTKNLRALSHGIKHNTNMSDIPNRYIVIDGVNIIIAENNSEGSSVSTKSRGFCVDVVDTSPTPVNGETLGGYANRKLREASVAKEERTYTREYAPDVYVGSLVKASIDGLEGDYRVSSQNIECSYGITVTETVYKEISLW